MQCILVNNIFESMFLHFLSSSSSSLPLIALSILVVNKIKENCFIECAVSFYGFAHYILTGLKCLYSEVWSKDRMGNHNLESIL